MIVMCDASRKQQAHSNPPKSRIRCPCWKTSSPKLRHAGNMHNCDVLGNEGRKALNACVKVKIYGKPETQKYYRRKSLQRLRGCYAYWDRYSWQHFDELFLPRDKDRNFESCYDIVDIHDALDKFDKRRCVEKYPKEEKQRDLIDSRRADVERELEEAYADPDGRLRYSWIVAQRRVRDCFAGNFVEDRKTLDYKHRTMYDLYDSYNVIDIYNAFVRWDLVSERCATQRAALLKEYAEATTAEGNVNVTLPKYSKNEALDRMVDHELQLGFDADDVLPVEMDAREIHVRHSQSYNVFDIYKALVQLDGKLLEKYPEESGSGSEELKKLIDKHRADLKEEYQKAKGCEASNQSLPEYTRSEAERRVRDCFAGTFPIDTEIFSKKGKDENDQTYDILDIKNAIDHFDKKTLFDAYKCASKRQLCIEFATNTTNQKVDEQRASIQQEYDEATKTIEIEHGSGFIVHDHFIITNKHVIQTYLTEKEKAEKERANEEEKYTICISNAEIDDLPCTVIHYDPGKDLALLYCPDLNLEQCRICPLQLSNQSLLPGMSVFTFGYPMSHTEETALFVSGNVSGSKRKYGGPSMIVLNCSLNSGNSGGPVLHWVNGQLKVVGVATQKHFKEILTLEERETIEKIRKSLQTRAISDVSDCDINSLSFSGTTSSVCGIPISILTLNLYDALETHTQFNLSNAIPGKLVVDFISEYAGEHKKELAEVIKYC